MQDNSGDGQAASAAIEQWLGEARDVPHGDDIWQAMRRTVEQLSATPLVRRDRIARDIIRTMAYADDMDGFQAALARLDERVKVLLARKAGTDGGGAQQRRRPTRTLLRL